MEATIANKHFHSQMYLDCREEDLIDSSLVRRADVLNNVCPVHKGTVDGPGYVGRGQDQHIGSHLDLVKLSQESIHHPEISP